MHTIEWREKPGDYLAHFCPGCNEMHHIPMWGKNPWTFNDDFEAPTLTPSVRHYLHHRDEPERYCHYFIKNGYIEYCTDSCHELAGETLPLPIIGPTELPTIE